jgi:hypothetical protein
MRTLCILLTLSLAISAASACEIPLVLEETIQLPEATPYWDVMPHWNHNYYWMSAIGTVDTTTIIRWSRTNCETMDSLITGRIGGPKHIAGFFGDAYSPKCVVSTYTSYYDGSGWADGRGLDCTPFYGHGIQVV